MPFCFFAFAEQPISSLIPIWGSINTSQTPSWAAISTSQTPNWTEIPV